MKINILLAGLLFASTTSLVGAPKTEVLTLAVFNFESPDEAVRDLGPKVAALVSAQLSTESQIITVERAELEKVLGEQELGLSGTVSAETAAKVGKLTGAKVLVTGRVFKADKEVVMVAKIISAETSRVYGEIVKGNATASATDLAGELAKKIAAVVTDKAGTLVAQVKTRDERLEQIKKTLKPGKLPTVSVRIPEHHFGQRTVDPAVETEIALLLGQLGFKVVDDKSDQRPDIEITGEAFSELGTRKGNLTSCKARVELKVRERTGGALLAVDRQTSVAVDLGEQIAGKTALQTAGAELAGRIIPKLQK